jgi:hypothetical protein
LTKSKAKQNSFVFFSTIPTMQEQEKKIVNQYLSNLLPGLNTLLLEHMITQQKLGYWNDYMTSACLSGNTELVQKCIEQGASNFNQGLFHACTKGHLNIVNLMEEWGADNWDFALSYAAENNQEHLFQHIFQNKTCRLSNYSFYDVCVNNNANLISLLRPQLRLPGLNSGLRGACEGGHQELVLWLINEGAVGWNQGLQGACSSGNQGLVDMMIEKGATAWNDGFLAACKSGHVNIVRQMIAKGATALHTGYKEACRNGHLDVVKHLIAQGMPRWEDGFHLTPLHCTKVIDFLIEKGGSTNLVLVRYICSLLNAGTSPDLFCLSTHQTYVQKLLACKTQKIALIKDCLRWIVCQDILNVLSDFLVYDQIGS